MVRKFLYGRGSLRPQFSGQNTVTGTAFCKEAAFAASKTPQVYYLTYIFECKKKKGNNYLFLLRKTALNDGFWVKMTQ